MKLEEKITTLRKQNLWSQEELAFRLDVSRQAVSKWESGSAIPDMDKIIKMSELFNVSTDFLLKEENRESSSNMTNGRYVSKEDSEEYIDIVKSTSMKFAFAVFLCIISPITLIILAGLNNIDKLSTTFAVGTGLAVLLILVAIAVVIFIVNGSKMKKYEYIEYEKVVISTDIKNSIRTQKDNDFQRRVTLTAIGVALCILASLPLILVAVFEGEDMLVLVMTSLLIFLVGVGVFLIIQGNLLNSAYLKLLQDGEYTASKKRIAKKLSYFEGVYWCFITAIYLVVSFMTNRWGITWIVWPIAAAIFGLINAIFNANAKEDDNK